MELHKAVLKYSDAGTFQPTSEDVKKYSQCRGQMYSYEGPIGAGKTTAGRNAAAMLNQIGVKAIFLEEKFNQEFLQLFLSDPAKYAFTFQISMLNACQRNYLEGLWYAKQGYVVIIDRTVWGNAVFAAMHVNNKNITNEEFKVYCSCINQYGPYKFDYVIYLDIDPETSMKRIKQRGRGAEKSYTLKYLQELEAAYYHQIYTQMTSGHSDIMILSNDDFYDPSYILDRIIDPKRKDAKEFIFEPDLSPETRNLSTKDIREGFRRLREHFSPSEPDV